MSMAKENITDQIRKKAILDVLATFNADDFKEEGIFRKSVENNDLTKNVDSLVDPLIPNHEILVPNMDPYLKAASVKQLLRELKKSHHALFNQEITNALVATRDEPKKDIKLENVATALSSLSDANKLILSSLLTTCSDIAASVDTNLMTPTNLAVVIAPNLGTFGDTPAEMMASVQLNDDFTFIIENKDALAMSLQVEQPIQVKSKLDSAVNKGQLVISMFTHIKQEIENKDWEVSLGGGVTVMLDNGNKKTLPKHAAELYQVCQNTTLDNMAESMSKVDEILSNRDSPKTFIDWVKSLFSSRKESTKEFYKTTEDKFNNLKEDYNKIDKGPDEGVQENVEQRPTI